MKEKINKTKNGFRDLTDGEKADLITWYIEERNLDEKEAVDLVLNYSHTCKDDYISDSPGYAGKILIGIYGCEYLIMSWKYADNGELIKIEIEG